MHKMDNLIICFEFPDTKKNNFKSASWRIIYAHSFQTGQIIKLGR